MQKDNHNDSLNFSFDIQNDIVYSMGQKINDLSLSLSQISTKNQQLRKQLSQSQIFSQQKIQKCPSGHPLRYQLADSTINAPYLSCDNCSQYVDKKSNVLWHCERCDYDLCRSCGGFRKNLCPYFHPLEYIHFYQGNHFQCDICYKKQLKSGWHCDCNFDICEQCHDSN